MLQQSLRESDGLKSSAMSHVRPRHLALAIVAAVLTPVQSFSHVMNFRPANARVARELDPVASASPLLTTVARRSNTFMRAPAPEKDQRVLPTLPYFDDAVGPLDGPVDLATSADAQDSVALGFASVFVVTAFLLTTLLSSNGANDTFLSMSLVEKLEVLQKVSWVPGQTDDAKVVVAAVMAISAFAQALTGFGFAVVSVGTLSSMSWLLHSELYDVITPVAATTQAASTLDQIKAK